MPTQKQHLWWASSGGLKRQVTALLWSSISESSVVQTRLMMPHTLLRVPHASTLTPKGSDATPGA